MSNQRRDTEVPSKKRGATDGKPGDRAIGPDYGGKGAPKGPRLPEDTTAEGDAKDGRGEDNHAGQD